MNKLFLLSLFLYYTIHPMVETTTNIINPIQTFMHTYPIIPLSLFCGTIQAGLTIAKEKYKDKNPDSYNQWVKFFPEMILEIGANPKVGIINNIPIGLKKGLNEFITVSNKAEKSNNPVTYVKSGFDIFFHDFNNKNGLAKAGYALSETTKTILFFPRSIIKYLAHTIKTPIVKKYASKNPESIKNFIGTCIYLLLFYSSVYCAQTYWLEFLFSHSDIIHNFINKLNSENVIKTVKQIYRKKAPLKKVIFKTNAE